MLSTMENEEITKSLLNIRSTYIYHLVQYFLRIPKIFSLKTLRTPNQHLVPSISEINTIQMDFPI